jgi:hypothetical protein
MMSTRQTQHIGTHIVTCRHLRLDITVALTSRDKSKVDQGRPEKMTRHLYYVLVCF